MKKKYKVAAIDYGGNYGHAVTFRTNKEAREFAEMQKRNGMIVKMYKKKSSKLSKFLKFFGISLVVLLSMLYLLVGSMSETEKRFEQIRMEEVR